MKLSDFVIVIGRQCGSGGRELGHKLATRLGVKYYDRELLMKVAEEEGISPGFLAANDEKKPSLLKSMLSACLGVQSDPYPGEGFNGDELLQATGCVVRKIMEGEGCVIVGRASDYIGRDLPNMVSVFLHADLPVRVACVKKREGSGDPGGFVAEKIRKADSRRRDFYNYVTGRNWGETDNYHLSFDTGKISLDAVADLIELYLKHRAEALSAAEAAS